MACAPYRRGEYPENGVIGSIALNACACPALWDKSVAVYIGHDIVSCRFFLRRTQLGVGSEQYPARRARTPILASMKRGLDLSA